MYEALISNLCELEKIKAENARLRQERDAVGIEMGRRCK